MASEREYLEKMSTEQLEALLVQESYGRALIPLSTIYLLCRILSRRTPIRGTAKDIFLEFARQYADNQKLAEH